MDKIMVKVAELYDLLQVKAVELNGVEKELVAKKAEQDSREKALVAGEKNAAIKLKAVRHITNIIAEEQKAEGMMVDAQKAQTILVSDKEKFDGFKENEEKKIAKLLQDAQDTETETNATRARLVIEVNKLEERKAKVREEVLNELRGA